MQKCRNCAKKFKWKVVFKSIWRGYSPIECEDCQSKHYINFPSRVLFAMTISAPLLFQNYLHNLLGGYSFWVYPLWVFLLSVSAPFIARYSMKKIDNA
jgi:CXXC-20-CXXC protein